MASNALYFFPFFCQINIENQLNFYAHTEKSSETKKVALAILIEFSGVIK